MISLCSLLSFLNLFNPSIPLCADKGIRQCKAFPGTSSWPTVAQWNELNATLNGNLLHALPPGAVCDSDLPKYNNATCTQVRQAYGNSDFHAQDPMSVDWPNWEDDECLPDPRAPCNLDQFPRFVVNASKAEYVQAGVNFARQNNVRLIVKGTGHDFLGRYEPE